MIGFRLTRDDISPALSALARTAHNPRPVLRAMGTTFKGITEGTFNSAGSSYRPTPWPAKYGGAPSNLQKSTTLAKAFHLAVTSAIATLSNAMVYARIHQLGGTIKPKQPGGVLSWIGADGKRVFARLVKIPARPFFPVLNGKLTPAAEEKIMRAGQRAIERQSPGGHAA